MRGTYRVTCYDPNGCERWNDNAENLIATLGKNQFLNAALSGVNYTAAVYVGLIGSTGFTTGLTSSDSMTAHTGWAEATINAARRPVTWAAASAGNKAFSAPVQVSITAPGTIKGCFLVFGTGASATVGNTGGVLFSAALFTKGDRVVGVGDTLNVTYSVTSTVVDTGGGGSTGGGGGGGGGGTPPSGDFAARIAAPGVFKYFDFDTTAKLGIDASAGLGYTPTTSFGYGLGTDNSVSNPTPTVNTSKRALEFSILGPGPCPAPAGGTWQTRFSDDDSLLFGENSEFYIQFGMQHDGYYTHPNINGPKISFFGCNGGQAVGSSGDILTVIFNTAGGSGKPFFYTYRPDTGTWGLGDYETQFGTGSIQLNCPYPWSGPNCYSIAPNAKYYFQFGVQVFNKRADLGNNAWNARVRCWMTFPDGTTKLIVDYDPATTLNYYPLPADPTTPGQKFGKFEFLTYLSHGADGTHPSFKVWFDQLILSTQRIPDPGGAQPAWRSAMTLGAVANISTNIPATPFRAAGYDVDPYRGDSEDWSYNLSAWGAGTYNPYVGKYGSLIAGADGHENQSSATLHLFDLETATWLTPIGAPQIHRCVAPNYLPPPTGWEYFYNPDKVAVNGVPVTDLSNYQLLTRYGTTNGGTFTLTWNGQTTAPIAWNCTALDIQNALVALSNVNPGDVTVTLTAHNNVTGMDYFVLTWASPTAPYPNVNPGGLTSSDGTAALYLIERWAGLDAVINERTSSNGLVVRTSPWHTGNLTFRYFPLIYGPRFKTNSAGGIRYDNMALIPPSMGGEANGSIYFVPLTFTNAFAVVAGLTGSRYAYRFGCTTRDWIAPPSNPMPQDGGVSDPCVFVSEKHKKIFTFGATGEIGVYDPVANSHSNIYFNYPYGFINWSQMGGIRQTCGIVTEGHPQHIFITTGAWAANTAETLLLVHDGDEFASWVGTSTLFNGPRGYGMYPQGQTGLTAPTLQLALLTAPLTLNSSNSYPTLSWSRNRKKLIIFNVPLNDAIYGPIDHRLEAPNANTCRVVTIPEGVTNGVPNWRTQPWTVQSVTITSVTGLHVGRISASYRRVFYCDALDCLIIAAGPEQQPSVQAVQIF